ncbi:MAG: CoA transferase [Deltaproteobacteria bacterium]|nr:CoA transferase [Deltaproteobacteria bacterium]
MSKALDNVVVLDLTTEFWSSIGTALLADFGATVIKIENLPDAHGRQPNDPSVPWDYQAELAQRNKLGLALNLDDDAGRAILRELIRKADVFVTDWPRVRIEQRQLDYASLCALKPDIIFAHASGFGPKGPDRDLPALDELAAARTGMMPIMPQPGQPPVYAGAGQMYTAVMIAFGVSLALHHRQATGEGQEVDVSLFAGNIYGASLDVQAFLAMGGERFLHPVARMDAGNPMSGILYPSQDGRWVCVTMPDTDRWWPGFSAMMGLDQNDPRFNSHEKRCGENRLELIRVLEDKFRQQPAEHWKRELTQRQLSADVIEEFDYPANDPQALRNRYILELDRPGVGRIKTLGFPIFMSETPGRLSRTAPCLGQHSAEILHELLGYSEDRIGELAAGGVIV